MHLLEIGGNPMAFTNSPVNDHPKRETMSMNRREFIAASVAGAVVLQRESKAFAAQAGNIQVTVDATKSGAQISPLVFGGYLEPATTQVWAEILTDRKFANPITSTPTPAPANPFFRRFFGEPFKPVGPEGTVVRFDPVEVKEWFHQRKAV